MPTLKKCKIEDSCLCGATIRIEGYENWATKTYQDFLNAHEVCRRNPIIFAPRKSKYVTNEDLIMLNKLRTKDLERFLTSKEGKEIILKTTKTITKDLDGKE